MYHTILYFSRGKTIWNGLPSYIKDSPFFMFSKGDLNHSYLRDNNISYSQVSLITSGFKGFMGFIGFFVYFCNCLCLFFLAISALNFIKIRVLPYSLYTYCYHHDVVTPIRPLSSGDLPIHKIQKNCPCLCSVCSFLLFIMCKYVLVMCLYDVFYDEWNKFQFIQIKNPTTKTMKKRRR